MNKKVVLAMGISLNMILMAGCGGNQQAVQESQLPTQTVEETAQADIEQSDEQQTAESTQTSDNKEQKIILNQLGYLPNAVKKVIFTEGNIGDSFKVVDTASNEAVFTGKISKEAFGAGDCRQDFIGEFSEVTKPGNYKIVSDTLGESYAFTIGEDVYKDVFKDAVKFFYYQRCGQELTEEFAGEWAHPACHTEEAVIYGTDKKIDVSGGWHDAGDYGRYVVATSKAAADLMLAYESNSEACGDDFDIPESGNGIPDILDEVKYQLQWMLKMQDKESGGVYHKVTCANFPDFVMPQEETGQLIVCPISTTATGDFAAVMAMGSRIYKDIDKSLADECLKAAERAWDYLDKTPSSSVDNPDGIVTGAYEDDKDIDERFWAAAELFKATDDMKYEKKIEEIAYSGTEFSLGYGWQCVAYYGIDTFLTSEKVDASFLDGFKNIEISYVKDYLLGTIESDAYEITNNADDFYWGSNMNILNNALVLDQASKLDNDNPDFEAYAVERVNYCFGKNPLAMSYVTGYGTVYPQHPHHRPSVAKGKTIPGMLVGGANAALQDDTVKEKAGNQPAGKRYVDDFTSYSTNEVDIYWNSTLVYALAKLHLV